MFDIQKLIRPHLLHLKPYASARDEFKQNADIKADVFLDANENAMGSVSKYFHNRYPDPLQKDVKICLSENFNYILKNEIKSNEFVFSPNNIFFGNGSDEPIDLLIRLFCEPAKDQIMICPPTYGMYEVSANIHNVGIKEIALNSDFQLNIPEILKNIDQNTTQNIKIIFLCSPNNPTGNVLKTQDILDILQKTNENSSAIVVVDEAYIDFVDNQCMWLSQLHTYKNLVILRTFSKAWGLADIRLGMAFGDELLISFLNKIKPPYNINQHTQETALLALKQWQRKDNFVAELLEQRIFLENELKNLPVIEKVYPSDANFLLVKVKDANKAYQFLLKNGIVVRNRTNVKGCENCLRITVGTFAENNEIISCLQDYAD